MSRCNTPATVCLDWAETEGPLNWIGWFASACIVASSRHFCLPAYSTGQTTARVGCWKWMCHFMQFTVNTDLHVICEPWNKAGPLTLNMVMATPAVQVGHYETWLVSIMVKISVPLSIILYSLPAPEKLIKMPTQLHPG